MSDAHADIASREFATTLVGTEVVLAVQSRGKSSTFASAPFPTWVPVRRRRTV